MMLLGIVLIMSMPVADNNAMALTNIQHPETGTIDANVGTKTNVKYIPNAEYFRSNPIYGQNIKRESDSENSCGAVAAQMLLNYHNYYSDRRIIDDEYLFIGEDSPNQCTDPTLTTSKTLGSVSWDEAYHSLYGKYKATGYFKKVLGYISAGGKILWQVKNGLEDIIADRKKEVGGDFIFNTVYHLEKLGATAVAPEAIRQYLDAGYPVILEMTKPLGGIDHFVVAYGYEELKSSATNHESSFGYIVNYGWSGDGDHAWVSSSWVNGYVVLQSNHKHNYTQYVGGDYAEYKCGCGHRISAYETEELSSGDLKITGLKNQISGAVTIPATLNNKAITEIGKGAFENQTELTYISTMSGVMSIGDNAFAHCTKLETVYLHAGTKYIGDNAFYYSGLTSLRIPRSVVTIGNSAFGYCQNLQVVNFETGSKATTIGEEAFINCDELSVVNDLSSQINEIKRYTFKGDSKLAKVTFDKSASKINSINEYAFAYCPALTTISLPNSVKNIYQYAFYSCSNLTTFNLNNVTTLYLGAFEYCTKLASFSKGLSNTTLTIDDDRAVYKGNSIIAYAPGNTNEEYTLKTNTTRIEEGAFMGAKNLISVTLPVNLTDIGQHAFDGCIGIKDIVIHQLCANIGAYAFNYCRFNSVTMYSTGNIQFGTGAFNKNFNATIIYVPNSRLTYYRNADNLDVVDDNIKSITFKITYDTNGGTAVAAQNVYYGSTVKLPTNTTKVGYGLEGWYRSETNDNGSGTQFASGAPYNDKGDITLHAKWVAKADGNVKFDSNGGRGGMGGTGGTGGEGGNKWSTNNLADSGARGATGTSGSAGIEKSESK